MSGDRRLGNVQALRAIAALLVVLMHATVRPIKYYGATGPVLEAVAHVMRAIGHLGVDLFFVISGFVMFTIAERTSEGITGRRMRETGRFLWRRARRIYPVYWLAVGSMVALVGTASHVPPLTGDALFRQLLLITTSVWILPIAWTLVFEAFFYVVVAAALVLGGRHATSTLGIWIAVEAILVGAWVVAPNADSMLAAWQRSVALDPLVLEFGLGCAAAAATRRSALPLPLALAAGAALILTGAIALYPAVAEIGAPIDPIRRVVHFGIGSAFLLGGAVTAELHHGRVAPPWLQSLGDASYSLYLWHIPVITLVAALGVWLGVDFAQAGLPLAATAFVASVIVALASYRWIEQPILERW